LPASRVARDLHARFGINIHTTTEVLRALAALAQECIWNGETLYVPGLGTIHPKYKRPKRVVCNLPHPNLRGKTFEVPLRVTAALKAARAFLREERVPVSAEVLAGWVKEKQQRKKARRARPRMDPYIAEILKRGPQV